MSPTTETPRTLTEAEISQLFLEPNEVEHFNRSPPDTQDALLREWGVKKGFLKHFPLKTLPKHHLQTQHPGKRPDPKKLLLYFGWQTTWEKVYEVVKQRFPNKIKSFELDGPNVIGTSLRAVPLIAEACGGLSLLTLKTALLGPYSSQNSPVFAVSNNYETDEQREGLSVDGIKKLKDMFGLEGEPMWFVVRVLVAYSRCES